MEENADLFRAGVAADRDARRLAVGPLAACHRGRPGPGAAGDHEPDHQRLGGHRRDRPASITLATGVQECDAELPGARAGSGDGRPPGGSSSWRCPTPAAAWTTRRSSGSSTPSSRPSSRAAGSACRRSSASCAGTGAPSSSTAPWAGARTVRVLFPASTGPPARRRPPPASARARRGAALPAGRCWWSDDEESVRDVCKAMVESLGLRVLTAADGREAVEVFRAARRRDHHVILDLSMPNMDGRAALRGAGPHQAGRQGHPVKRLRRAGVPPSACPAAASRGSSRSPTLSRACTTPWRRRGRPSRRPPASGRGRDYRMPSSTTGTSPAGTAAAGTVPYRRTSLP